MFRSLVRMVDQEVVRKKLVDTLKPALLEVNDVSGGCGASYDALIVSDAFEGKRLLDRQRLVNDALKEELKDIHAFTMKCVTPAEWEKRKPS
ncbi:unnamed protein product [Vitrella brassicaformis CCMP3155]|uniref:BolA-like protein n=1 Tax=Vitrella brassicaformis (strain CCMP3155) TaxID=1169540 RepID=A0A0G4G061_VITBC|nr:unnamed protein product [Vitrella brassicaformis CCMP3155]|eukprot:CEM21072.1 unnamed protein product [Vitrella brassicaformis CCMP3155]